MISAPFIVRFKNDYYPVFASNTPHVFNIYENETVPKILHTFVATDNDIGIAGDVKYQTGDANLDWLFELASSSGVFKLKSGLDRENVSSYSMVIRAVDSAPSPFELAKNLILTVNVLDVNDNKPEYSWPVLNFSIPETLVVGDAAFNVTTTDADAGENGRLTYKLLATNATGTFSLDSNTGVFSVTCKYFSSVLPVSGKHYITVASSLTGGRLRKN